MENTQSKKFYQKKWFWVVIGIFVIVILGSSGSSKSNSKSQLNNVGAKVDTEKVVETIKVTAEDLMKDYEANEVSADQKYKGKILEISGTINTIGKDILDKPYVTLVTSNIVLSVQCMFDKSSEAQLAELSKDKAVTLRGEGSGKLVNVLIKKCEIVK